MKVEPKRVKKVPSPLLLIGLGGTGSDALLTIMDKFNRRYELPVTANGDVLDTPERTAYLAFDTDLLELQGKQRGNMKFAPGNIFKLSIPSVINTEGQPEFITSWLNKDMAGFQIKNGAGGVRQAGRYVLFHNVDDIYTKLKTVIHNLLATAAGGTMGTLDVVLTTGVSGGTGAGTFMDMAYILRHVMRTEYPTVDYNFMAYILMPPVNVGKIANISQPKKDLLESTGFAALKELDFWMNYHTHKYSYVQKYSSQHEIAWNACPFDNVVLMGDANEDGDIITDAYENCLDVLGESVVNFFAHEVVKADQQSSLRSHLSNIEAEKQTLHKLYPANYTYMTVGAAMSDSQQDEMATYESKLIFDRIEDLQQIDKVLTMGSRHSAPLLGKHEGEEFLEKFLPASTDYFGEFFNIMPDLGIFSDPSWTPQVVYDSPAVHEGYYNDWCHECALEAEKFAVEQVKQLRRHFRELVEAYATDLTYGPFTVSNFLKDPDLGFVWFFNNVAENWNTQEHTIQIERNNSFAEVSTVMYSEMRDLPKIARIAGLWGPAKKYFERCANLFALERDYELAKYMAREIKSLQQEIKAYAENVLPTFCNLLLQVGENAKNAMKTIELETDTGDIVTAAQLKAYIDKAFGSPEQDKLAIKVISRMINLSQRIELDNMGTIIGLSELRESFVKAADQFVLDATTIVNGESMDKLVNIKLGSDAKEQDKVDYIAQELLTKLKKAARTMLPLTRRTGESVQYLPYAYVSIPSNAPLIQAGVAAYGGEGEKGGNSSNEKITPKCSDVSDMIFWLNTYSCLPMCMYTDLARLEKVYNTVIATDGVKSLHLVQTAMDTGEHLLRHDWSLLPSPVMHKLQNLKMPDVVERRQKEISEMLEQALANGAASLTVAANGQEHLNLRLRMKNGIIETMDQFDRKLKAITEDSSTTPEQKIQKLNDLGQEGVMISKGYKNFTEVFAAAEGLKLSVTTHTDAEIRQAAENKEKARRMAAAYILYAWYPQIAEQMMTQKEMFRKLTEAVKAQEAIIEGATGLQKFINRFLLLYLSDTFTMGRTSVKYKNFRGDDEELIAKASFTDDELTVYSDFCPALVILSVLGNSNDARVNSHDRQYLMDKGEQLEKDIDLMTDDDYAELQKKAKVFNTEYAQTADAIRYDKGSMPTPVREQMIDLLEMLRKAAKLYA